MSRKTELPPPGKRNPPPDETTCQAIDDACNGDARLAELWKHLLSTYTILHDDEDEESVKFHSYIRYADLREVPMELRRGGFLIKMSPDTITLKHGNAIWKVSRRFCLIFRKKDRDDLLLEAAESMIESVLLKNRTARLVDG